MTKLNKLLGTEKSGLSEQEKYELVERFAPVLLELNKAKKEEEFMELFGNGVKLNIGCGNRKLKGFINIDKMDGDIPFDLEMGLPDEIKDNTVTGVYASHILEHIRNLPKLMEDIWSVCMNEAKVVIKVPYYNSKIAFDDPTHVRFFTEHTLEYFSQDHRKKNLALFDYNYKCNFKIVDREISDGVMVVTMEVVK